MQQLSRWKSGMARTCRPECVPNHPLDGCRQQRQNGRKMQPIDTQGFVKLPGEAASSPLRMKVTGSWSHPSGVPILLLLSLPAANGTNTRTLATNARVLVRINRSATWVTEPTRAFTLVAAAGAVASRAFSCHDNSSLLVAPLAIHPHESVGGRGRFFSSSEAGSGCGDGTFVNLFANR